MKKIEFKKLAILGIVSGTVLSAQANAAFAPNASSSGTYLAGGCGGSNGCHQTTPKTNSCNAAPQHYNSNGQPQQQTQNQQQPQQQTQNQQQPQQQMQNQQQPQQQMQKPLSAGCGHNNSQTRISAGCGHKCNSTVSASCSSQQNQGRSYYYQSPSNSYTADASTGLTNQMPRNSCSTVQPVQQQGQMPQGSCSGMKQGQQPGQMPQGSCAGAKQGQQPGQTGSYYQSRQQQNSNVSLADKPAAMPKSTPSHEEIKSEEEKAAQKRMVNTNQAPK